MLISPPPPPPKKKKKKKKLMEIFFIIIIDIIQTVGELMGNPPLVQRLTVIINLNTVRTRFNAGWSHPNDLHDELELVRTYISASQSTCLSNSKISALFFFSNDIVVPHKA